MEIHEIRDLCIKSCEKYYDYLSGNKKSIEEIEISRKSKIENSDSLWELLLGGRIFNFDAVKIFNKRHQELYSDKHFSVESYDADTNRLVIELKESLETFKDTNAQYLLIISDLKFLVENVKNWYVTKGNSLKLPLVSNDNEESSDKREIKFLTEFDQPDVFQTKAIENALTNKLSYIWGPPGTGKTHCVLVNSVFNYINNDNNLIGVFAPTNNALEEVMAALLTNAEKQNIPREKFLRLGAPSRKFASTYPEVCEVASLAEKTQEIKSQIQIIKDVINYRRGINALNSADFLIINFEELEKHLTKRDELLLKYSKLKTVINDLRRKVDSLMAVVKRIFISGYSDEQLLLEENIKQYEEINSKIKKIEDRIELQLSKIKRIRTDSPKIDNELDSLNFHNLDNVKKNIKKIRNETEKYLNIRKSHANAYVDLSNEQLESRKIEFEEKLEYLKKQQIDERIKNCVVLGSTLDTYISRRLQNQDFSFNHIFLDEAGYVPIIKALILFQGFTPVTFFGDHKQLPPVCEMNEIAIKKPQNREVALWDKPSIFCETMFYSSKENLLNEVFENDIPDFKYTVKSELKITYRFGSNLTKILDKLFYNFGFSSVDDSDTNTVNLFLIDAPLPNQTSRRQNIAECEAIKKLLKSNSMSDYIILTPYKDQVALINSHIPEARRENRVLTIHKSQGREWDAVIISVVDCKHTKRPWFTDTLSKKSKGALVLNTAVSRVRKKIFLICDKNYWLNRHDSENQLISNLIFEGEEIDS